MAVNPNEKYFQVSTAKDAVNIWLQLTPEMKLPITTEVQEKAMLMRSAVEAKNVKDFTLEAVNIITDWDNLEKYFEIFWINESVKTQAEKQILLEKMRVYIKNIAFYYASWNLDLQKVDFNRRKELFLSAMELPKLKQTVEEVEKWMLEYATRTDMEKKISEWKYMSMGTSSVYWELKASMFWPKEENFTPAKLEDQKIAEGIAEVFSGKKSEAQIAKMPTEKKETDQKQETIKWDSKVVKVYSEFSKWASEWDKKILEAVKDKVAVNSETWELTLKDSIKFWDSWELVLSPDKKWVILKWYGYTYNFAKFDSDTLWLALNKISSLVFLDNASLTVFAPEEMWKIATNINRYHGLTWWTPINLGKNEWLTSVEKNNLLSVMKDLGVIPSYDPNNLSKRIISKEEFTNNLIYKTSFYKWQWQLDTTALDNNLKKVNLKRTPQSA